MEITSAQYIQDEGVNSGIKINNSQTVDPANTDYAEIMRQVNAGTLTIADAD